MVDYNLIDDENTTHDDECCQTQKIGGKTYKLCPNQLIQPPGSFSTQLMKRLTLFAFSPFLITFGVTFSAFMYIVPKSISSKITSIIIPKCMDRVGTLYAKERKILLSPDSISDKKVLDLGSGGGAYMRYLSSASKIVALEIIKQMHPKIKDSAEKANISMDQLEILDCTIENYIESHPNEIGTFDWIILGNVLCEVPSQISTLQCVDKLLKINGYVYFSEHVANPPGSMKRFFQDLLNPWWNLVSGGCNCNRETMKQIQQMKNWDVISWDYGSVSSGGPPIIGPFHLGLAQKMKNKAL